MTANERDELISEAASATALASAAARAYMRVATAPAPNRALLADAQDKARLLVRHAGRMDELARRLVAEGEGERADPR